MFVFPIVPFALNHEIRYVGRTLCKIPIRWNSPFTRINKKKDSKQSETIQGKSQEAGLHADVILSNVKMKGLQQNSGHRVVWFSGPLYLGHSILKAKSVPLLSVPYPSLIQKNNKNKKKKKKKQQQILAALTKFPVAGWYTAFGTSASLNGFNKRLTLVLYCVVADEHTFFSVHVNGFYLSMD